MQEVRRSIHVTRKRAEHEGSRKYKGCSAEGRNHRKTKRSRGNYGHMYVPGPGKLWQEINQDNVGQPQPTKVHPGGCLDVSKKLLARNL